MGWGASTSPVVGGPRDLEKKTFGIIFLWGEIERLMLTDPTDRVDYGVSN